MNHLRKIQLFLFIPLIWGNLTTVTYAQSLNENNNCEISEQQQYQPGFNLQTQHHETETIISANTPSQTEMSIPSLWWAVEQFDPFNGKLVTYWEANKNTKVISLRVNDRFWLNLDYLDRYSLVNQFGTVAREYDYNLEIINQQQDCLATYTCDLSVTPHHCQIQFNSL